jgi:hypothetical protein
VRYVVLGFAVGWLAAVATRPEFGGDNQIAVALPSE